MEVTAMGMAKLPIQVLPHPIGQLSDEMMRDIADEAYEELVFAITANADKVATKYSEAVGLGTEYTYKGAVLGRLSSDGPPRPGHPPGARWAES
jgi:hypothetical protein